MFSFAGSNLKNLLSGNARDRELADTRAAWEETQTYWHASPLATKSLYDLSLGVLKVAIERLDRLPSASILNTSGVAVEALLRVEEIGELEPLWDAIGTSVGLAVGFRKMLERRRRWATDFDQVYGAFRRITAATFQAFFQSLPESCFGEPDEDAGDTFEVPLIDLLDDPVSVVEQLFMLPYDDASFRLDLFNDLRELCGGNALVASGFLRSDNIHERSAKLIMPNRQKNKTGAELAELYLAGSPLKDVLDVTIPFRIPERMRFEHCHIVGGTGHGKTQLMQKMIHADLQASQQDNRAVVVIDSQGDLISKLVRLDLFSPEATGSLADRLVVIDPADVEFPAALNLFDAHLDRVRGYDAANRERVLNGVIELYELFFGAFLGAELTQKQGVIFKYLARLMLAIPDATIHTLMRIMEDGKQFKPYMERLDGSARYFFESEFFHPSFAATKKQVLRRLWGVLSTPAFERMFTQPKNKLDLFEAMNEGKIVLISTAKDLLKREGSQLLGRFFIATITQAALERSTLPEHLRNPTLVYVDEAQEYFDDSIETILSQARKYHVGLTLAHQTLDQLTPRLRSSILANTSMKCAGGVSAKDARALADELHTTPEFIDGMKRRGPRSEFAVWVKHITGHAIRLSVPLGFLERQSTLTEEEYDGLISANRDRYCGKAMTDFAIAIDIGEPAASEDEPKPSTSEPPPLHETAQKPIEHPRVKAVESEAPIPKPRAPEPLPSEPVPPTEAPPAPANTRPEATPTLGKGGPKHRYVQAMAKQLAEQQGLKATLEAPLSSGDGEVDVLIERDGVLAAIEISVTTPLEYERENLNKCLRAGYPSIAVVLAKSRTTFARYRDGLSEGLSEPQRACVSFLTPEELPDFIAALAPAPSATESVVKGYRVRVTQAASTPQDVKARRDAIARIISQSVANKG